MFAGRGPIALARVRRFSKHTGIAVESFACISRCHSMAGTAFLALARRGPRDRVAWLAGAADLTGLVLLLSVAPRIARGEVMTWTMDWVPHIGLALSFRVDGLAFLFALLIFAIGLLVILYARYYLSNEANLTRFYFLLMMFTGVLLGFVLPHITARFSIEGSRIRSLMALVELAWCFCGMCLSRIWRSLCSCSAHVLACGRGWLKFLWRLAIRWQSARWPALSR